MLRVKHKIMRLSIGAVAVVALALAALGGTTPAAHADAGVYPRGIYGPQGTCTSCYIESGVWFDGGGVGFAGHERWTYSNGDQVSSVATWNASGLDPNTQYDICAYIPDNNANANATYIDYAANGTSDPNIVNQQAFSNQWAFVDSVRPTRDGQITVIVTDQSSDPQFSTVVGADAMLFIPSSNDTVAPFNPGDESNPGCTPNFPS
jgi:hypothetical protein